MPSLSDTGSDLPRRPGQRRPFVALHALWAAVERRAPCAARAAYDAYGKERA